MTEAYDAFLKAYGDPGRPNAVTQVPLDSDDSHYGRLLALPPRALPSAWDLGSYSDDIAYQPEVQGDLFACLLPTCLLAWQQEQLGEGPSERTGAVEVFLAAVARRPLLAQHLQPAQAAAVERFMTQTLLARLDQQTSLACPAKRALVFPWIYALGTQAVLFANLESLWAEWWGFKTTGRAATALQYLSCLLYDDCANPLLVSQHPNQKYRLVPPPLWDTDGQISNTPWRMENIVFLIDTLTPDYACQSLNRIIERLDGEVDSPLPKRLRDGFEVQKPLLAHRLRALPELLAQPVDGLAKWPALA